MKELARFYDRCAAYYQRDYESIGYHHDVPFYVDLARRSGGPVLELGCGTGRVLLPTARAGVEVVGVDGSPGMLERLRAGLSGEPEEVCRRVRVLQGDIRSVRVPDGEAAFALVTAPFRVAQHLCARTDQRAWLRTVAHHLRRDPPGHLVFDVFQPDYELIADSPTVSVDLERFEPGTRKRIRRVSRADHHPTSQTFEVSFEWLVEEPGGEERTERTLETTLRWFTRGELECLLELEGFEVTDFWGDFEGTPFGADAEDQVIRARLARGEAART